MKVAHTMTLEELTALAIKRSSIKALIGIQCQQNMYLTDNEILQRAYNTKDINLLDSNEVSQIIYGATGRHIGGRAITIRIGKGVISMCEPWSTQLWMLATRAEHLHKHGNRLKELL